MNKRKTITIGIPAYNEAANITTIVQKLLLQKEIGFHLEKIIVVSDGSTDDTVARVRAIEDSRVVIQSDKKRIGKSARLNQLFRTIKSDILILVDADIIIKDNRLLAKALENTDIAKAGIVGVNACPLPARKFFEQTIEAGVSVMKRIAKRWRNGDNYLSFKGCFLVLDGKFAKSIHMPDSLVNNDAYLYFAALEKGYMPAYAEKCVVYYRSPMVLADQVKQSSRYQSSREELTHYFKRNWNDEYNPPLAIVTKSVLQSLIKDPLYLAGYIGIFFLTKVQKQKNIKSIWSIASSTKT